MSLVGLRKELQARGWECRVMNLNENRRVVSPEYIDVQSGWDYLRKLLRCVREGCAVHARVNGESRKGYIVALLALVAAQIWGRAALLTYGGGHHQTFFPAPRLSVRWLAFSILFRVADRIYCNNNAVKNLIVSTGIRPERVFPIPHTSPYYIEYSRLPLSEELKEFLLRHEGFFFSYVCFRKEFALEFLAEVIRRFRVLYPTVGFLWLGPWEREMEPMKAFLRNERINNDVFLMGSVPHEAFLDILSRSMAYIRTPVTDGVCSSVLESLKLKVPVLAADNGTRPEGTELWESSRVDSLLNLMIEVKRNPKKMVARIPEIVLEDNAKKLVDNIEEICLRPPLAEAAASSTAN